MTQFSPDQPTQNAGAHNNPASTPLGSIDVEKKKQQIEDNIRRLTESMDTQSISPSSNFDALDYAALSSAPSSERFAAADPYVNPTEPDFFDPAEMIQTEVQDPYPPAKSIDEILQKLNGYQTDLEFDEAAEEAKQMETESPIDIQPQPVDAAWGEMDDEVNAETDSPQKLEAVAILETQTDSEQAMFADIPSVEWFSDSAAPSPGLPPDASDELISEDPTSQIVAPLMGISDETEIAETVFDVRNFSDSSGGTIEPIPGSQDVDPEYFDFNVAGKPEPAQQFTASSSDATQAISQDVKPNEPGPSADAKPLDFATIPEITDPADPASTDAEDQLFVANDGDVININGADGFGYIDLVCFDVNEATFEPSIIKIDAEDGSRFEIHHSQIPFALFADGVKMDLISDDGDPQTD